MQSIIPITPIILKAIAKNKVIIHFHTISLLIAKITKEAMPANPTINWNMELNK